MIVNACFDLVSLLLQMAILRMELQGTVRTSYGKARVAMTSLCNVSEFTW